MRYVFYARECPSDVIVPSDLGGLRLEVWRPSMKSMCPKGLQLFPFGVWWIFDRIGVFASPEYKLLLIYEGDSLVHRSCIFPRYFRFPFMASEDLQVGDTWTDPGMRGRGLATTALRTAVQLSSDTKRRLWYLTEETNTPSIRAVQKAGFGFVGRGRRTSAFGLHVFGRFVWDHRDSRLPVSQ